MKIGFIGCVESSLSALNTLLTLSEVEIVAVVTRDASAVNSDFVNLAEVCKVKGIPYFYEDPKNRGDSKKFLEQFSPDVIYCIGWSYLLDQGMLNLARKGVVGFHPAKLPSNRGRHPIIWALVLGLEETASTFFIMDKGADSGPILSQKSIPISGEDTAATLYEKIIDVAQKQIVDFTLELANSSEVLLPQDSSKATYWRKRTRKDGLIDWRMGAESIKNLIRALSPPYPCAEFLYGEQFIRVDSSKIDRNTYPKNIEPGRVLAGANEKLLVKCAGHEAVWVNCIDVHNLPSEGDHL